MKLAFVALAAVLLQAQPRSPYIARGACPFEGCVYRAWTAKRALPLVDKPGSPRIVGRLSAGQRVRAVTGEVHSIPVRVVALHSHATDPPIRAGDEYWLLHPLGEGNWSVWYQGKLIELDDLSDSKARPKTEWWAKVRTEAGLEGWVRAENNFDGQDALAD